jgi:tight adherence protein C
MDFGSLLRPDSFAAGSFLWSPGSFALILGLAALLIWMAFAPASPVKSVQARLDGYLERPEAAGDDVEGSFFSRAVVPVVHKILHYPGMLLPHRNVAATEQMLLQAGEPLNMSAIDFLGLRVLLTVMLPLLYFVLLGRGMASSILLRNVLVLGLLGFLLPVFWLRSRVNARKHEITRRLPDALDMLTIGVEAGLAFETALLKVGEKWDNELTKEFRRAVREMRVGTPRDEAMTRMAQRCGVDDLDVFVAVLIQSSQLGISIAQVLHSQADEMRTKRRQRAEELAREASVKMVFPLVFFILPAMFMVILGPAVPSLMSLLGALGGGK